MHLAYCVPCSSFQVLLDVKLNKSNNFIKKPSPITNETTCYLHGKIPIEPYVRYISQAKFAPEWIQF